MWLKLGFTCFCPFTRHFTSTPKAHQTQIKAIFSLFRRILPPLWYQCPPYPEKRAHNEEKTFLLHMGCLAYIGYRFTGYKIRNRVTGMAHTLKQGEIKPVIL